MKRWLLTMMAALALVFTAVATPEHAHAQDAGEDEFEDEGSSSLEEGPPVRRLLLLRSGRFEVQPQATFTMNDPFVRNIGFGAGLAYYFTNALGIAADFTYAPVHIDTDETSAVASDGFSQRVKDSLSVSQLQMAFDVGVVYVPIFGKFSLFDMIFNYDLHLFGGAGVMLMTGRCADEGAAACSPDDGLENPVFAGAIGVGARLYFNNWIALNLEFRDMIGSWAEYSRGEDKAEVRQMYFGTVGVSFFFPFDVYISR